jgi:hypothetical protein
MKKVHPDQMSMIFQGHLGLIVGPGLTLGSGGINEVSASVAKALNVDPGQTYLDTCDAALAKGHAPETVRAALTTAISERPTAALSARLARVRWGAVLSFTPDVTLEDLIRSETNKNAFWPPGIVIDGSTLPIPPRVVPLLKILGTAGRDSLVVSRYEYSRARPRWRNALRAFLDLVKSAPVVCLGMTDISWALADVLAELSSLPIFVSRLVAPENDQLVLIRKSQVGEYKGELRSS